MRYPIMGRRRAGHDATPRRRLRVPAALAVAFVGSAGAVSMWYGGCTHDATDPPLDGGRIANTQDASPVDVAIDAIDASDAPRDAAPDAGAPDAPPQ